ncbi:MAG: endolytic transglycosylase MltG, partial [bacterium]|nr:endolytic transglycosylase MltG [bacterium]
TIPEGFDSEEIAEAFDKKLLNFDKEQFLALASGHEGRLFPDTYFFLSTDGAAEVFEALTENYNQKISLFQEDIALSGRTENEILTMASIIEGEASGDVDRALIAGILWKRFKIGMPLQADVAPITYKEKGLPKEPISNPGAKAIEAALFPETSPYLYYLHDPEGNIHYAKNFAEHVSNKRQYLK